MEADIHTQNSAAFASHGSADRLMNDGSSRKLWFSFLGENTAGCSSARLSIKTYDRWVYGGPCPSRNCIALEKLVRWLSRSLKLSRDCCSLGFRLDASAPRHDKRLPSAEIANNPYVSPRLPTQHKQSL